MDLMASSRALMHATKSFRVLQEATSVVVSVALLRRSRRRFFPKARHQVACRKSSASGNASGTNTRERFAASGSTRRSQHLLPPGLHKSSRSISGRPRLHIALGLHWHSSSAPNSIPEAGCLASGTGHSRHSAGVIRAGGSSRVAQQ